MAVAGAFVFAAQMINFAVPGTGSSGHLGGGVLLAALLGPYAGFLSMTCILAVQALFFADGGLLAFGCNLFNLGFLSCFVAYPLVFRPIARRSRGAGRVAFASGAASVVALQLGALGVVFQTLLSGRTGLDARTFVLLMQPIHLAIGVVEGLVTAAILATVHRARPELVASTLDAKPYRGESLRGMLVAGILLAVVTGAVVAWFASALPDGLVWSLARAARGEAPAQGGTYGPAILPDYGYRGADAAGAGQAAWPAISAGTSVSGVVGALLVLALAALAGGAALLLGRARKRRGRA